MIDMIERSEYKNRLLKAVNRSPVTILLGPRQCGKTTLAREIWKKLGGTYLDLDTTGDITRLQNPELFLKSLKGLVVIDEIQQMPSLFRILRPLADRYEIPARFLLLGSASPEIIRGVSETLAGRAEFIDLSGFNLGEIGISETEKLWFRGGFPRSFLSGDDDSSRVWLENFIRTFLERDLPQLGFPVNPVEMRRFWMMLASGQGQIVNNSSLARSMGRSYKTIQKHLDVFEGAYMIRRLRPWFNNTKKRLVKSSKVFIRDSGILHNLLHIDSIYALKGHSIAGFSWEGFVLEQFFDRFGSRNCYFWETHQGASIDLLFFRKGLRYGLEVKMNEAPGITKSMRIAMHDLQLQHLWVIYPGSESFIMDSKITALPLSDLFSNSF